ncbi:MULTISPECIES: TetR/AcrR family transcriptional regulator [unclassified Bradyrhizobium]|uniref:TetR/AcrR family transcriptional regulator n=1 Tax=unclassified Bradyrhizobium TaxID=2631580 RepID=UPI002478CEDA|nr:MULTISPECIES: TetR/AcrR family transcriptional regulator [unclassified Bradyrhizobium]WGS17986.1 TetR/AcrR family transcriptional regulator [Bradyrhizobium sp. ISRA463]WGS24793.1 TetR/AcrR family transcriptional regulator [Bradyrhizobium sp. ISRA464]
MRPPPHAMDAHAPSSNSQSPWLPFESRRRARDEKREAVLRTAVALFLEQGYHRATLNDVAKRLNITKPALYNYFRGKDEILFECWSLGNELVDDCIAETSAGGGTGLDKLRKLTVRYAELMTTDYGKSLVRFDVRDLNEDNRKIVQTAKRRIDRAFRSYIAEGVGDGSIRPCDPKLSAFAIAGSLNWIGHWFQPGGPMTGKAVAEEFAIRLTEGIATTTRKRADKPPRTGNASREDKSEHHARTAARAAGQSKRARGRLR